jgi:trans-aconitate methyltransferase
MTSARDWDAATYDRISAPQQTWAAERDRATALCQDLAELALPERVDAIFSNATFHWVRDHDALFAALHRNLKPGGRLVAQCGGRGNIESVRIAAETAMAREPFAARFADWPRPWTYATPEETADAVMAQLPEPLELGYVRLNMTARRADAATR